MVSIYATEGLERGCVSVDVVREMAPPRESTKAGSDASDGPRNLRKIPCHVQPLLSSRHALDTSMEDAK